MPESMLTKEMKEADREQELAAYNIGRSEIDEEVQE